MVFSFGFQIWLCTLWFHLNFLKQRNHWTVPFFFICDPFKFPFLVSDLIKRLEGDCQRTFSKSSAGRVTIKNVLIREDDSVYFFLKDNFYPTCFTIIIGALCASSLWFSWLVRFILWWRELLFDGYRCTFCILPGRKPPSVISLEQFWTNSFVSRILQSHPYSRPANSQRCTVKVLASRVVQDQTICLKGGPIGIACSCFLSKC